MDCRVLISGVILTIGLSLPACAQEVQKLTESNIREFIEKTAHLTSGRKSGMDDKEVDEYLETHISDDARFKSTMRYAVPGYDIQESTMSVDKAQFIKDVHKAQDSVSDYENQIEIGDIKIAEDGRTATIATRNLESGKMPVTDNIEQQEVPVQGMSSCTQILTLSKENVIQMFNATCVTDIQFDTFSP